VPNDFPFQILSEGFAIIELEVANSGSGDFELTFDEIRVVDSKGKMIERALSTDMAPKVFKYYKGSRQVIHGEGHVGAVGPRTPTRTVGIHPPAPSISADTGQRIRALLESYEIQPGVIAPQESRAGYFYLKSKRSGRKLQGASVHISTFVKGL
jgi:hypothetical protein